MSKISLPDITPAQISGAAVAIAGVAASLGLHLSATVQAALIAGLTVGYSALVLADAHLRHGRAAALPQLLSQEAKQVATEAQDQRVAALANAIGTLSSRVDQAVQSSGDRPTIEQVAQHVINRLAADAASSAVQAQPAQPPVETPIPPQPAA